MSGESQSFVSSDSEYADEETQSTAALEAHGGPKKRVKARLKDPFDVASSLPSDSMSEEMNAMKQVFLRISKKKVRQKEERRRECKRRYMEAFQSDVDQAFKRANKFRSKKMNEVATKIEGLGKQIQSSSSELRSAHAEYKRRFDAEFEAAKAEIDRLKQSLRRIDSRYIVAKEKIEMAFQNVNEDAEVALEALRTKLLETWEDKSFVKAFKPQVERLL